MTTVTRTCGFVPFHCFVPTTFSQGIHALGIHTIKAALGTGVPLIQSHTILADIVQVANGNGYTTGGVTVSVTEPAAWIGGTYQFNPSFIPTISASSSGFAFKSINFYNHTAIAKNLIGSLFSSGAITAAMVSAGTTGQASITNVAQSGTTVTLTITGHLLANADVVVIDQLPFPRMNGTFTIANVTANTFTITVANTATITSQAVATGKLIRPETVTLGAGGAYNVAFDPALSAFTASMRGVVL